MIWLLALSIVINIRLFVVTYRLYEENERLIVQLLKERINRGAIQNTDEDI